MSGQGCWGQYWDSGVSLVDGFSLTGESCLGATKMLSQRVTLGTSGWRLAIPSSPLDQHQCFQVLGYQCELIL